MHINASQRKRIDEASRTVTRAFVRIDGKIWDLFEVMDHGLAMQLLASRMKMHAENHAPGICTGNFEVINAAKNNWAPWAANKSISDRRDWQDDCGFEYNGRYGGKCK